MRSVQERVVREIRTLRAMRRGLETAHGSDIEALPTETGSNKLGRAYGAMAPVLDPTSRFAASICGRRRRRGVRLPQARIWRVYESTNQLSGSVNATTLGRIRSSDIQVSVWAFSVNLNSSKGRGHRRTQSCVYAIMIAGGRWDQVRCDSSLGTDCASARS